MPERTYLREVDRELKHILALGEANGLKLEQTRELWERTEQHAIETARAARSAEVAAISAKHSSARTEQVGNLTRDEISEVNGKVSAIEMTLDARLVEICDRLDRLLERQGELEVRQRNLETMLYGRIGLPLPQHAAAETTNNDAAASAEVGSDQS